MNLFRWVIEQFSERVAADKDRRQHARAMYAKYVAASRG